MKTQIILHLLLITVFSSTINLDLFQQIEGIGTFNIQSFELNNELYQAVCNTENGVTHIVNSKILKFDQNSNQFVLFQEIQTKACTGITAFQIQDQTFLGISNYYDTSNQSYITNSWIYVFNGSVFELYQEIETKGGNKMKFFEIDQDQYLAIGQRWDGNGPYVDSQIFKFNAQNSQFEVFQNFPTHFGRLGEFFEMLGERYFIFAEESTQNQNKLYKFEGNQFVEFQSFEANNQIQWVFFQMNGEYYLACSKNSYQQDNNNSLVYVFNENTGQFQEFQQLSTKGAYGIQHFSVDFEHYIAIGQYRDGQNVAQNSLIFQYDFLSDSFKEIIQINTQAVLLLDVYAWNGKKYLNIANMRDNSNNYLINSQIYEINLICGENTYMKQQEQLCPDCDQSCNQCNGGTYKDCVECAQDYIRVQDLFCIHKDNLSCVDYFSILKQDSISHICEQSIDSQTSEVYLNFEYVFNDDFFMNDDCAFEKIYFSDTLLQNSQYTKDNQNGFQFSMSYNDLENYNCQDISTEFELIYLCPQKIEIYNQKEVLQHFYSYEVKISTLIEQPNQINIQVIPTQMIQEECCEIDIFVKTELKMCQDLNCSSYYEDLPDIQRNGEATFEQIVVTPSFQDYYLLNSVVSILYAGNLSYIPNLKNIEFLEGKTRFTLSFPEREDDMILKVISLISKENDDVRRMLQNEQQALNLIEEDNRISSTLDISQKSQIKAEKSENKIEKYIPYFIGLGVVLIIGVVIIVVTCLIYKSKKQQQKNREEKYEDTEQLQQS